MVRTFQGSQVGVSKVVFESLRQVARFKDRLPQQLRHVICVWMVLFSPIRVLGQ